MSWKYRADELDAPNLAAGLDLATAAGGVRPPRGLFSTGNNAALQSADGVDSTPVITEIYVGAVFLPFTILATGISIFNGSVVATDKYRVILYNVAGTMLRSSAAAGFQPASTDAYEDVAFATGPGGTAATTIVLPSGTYFLGLIFNGTTNRFNAHGAGAFPGGKITGATFATAGITTEIAVTLPTAFTAANKPPIATLY